MNNRSIQFIRDDILNIVTWNTLADRFCGKDQNFTKLSSQDVLDWKKRKNLITSTLLEMNADIVCLQEVDKFDELNVVMKQHGYEGIFRPKQIAKEELKDGQDVDGCCIFFKMSKYILYEHRIFFYKSQSQIALFATFGNKMTGKSFIIVTTHLKSKPGYEDIRLAEVEQLLHDKWIGHNNINTSFIVGDFNDVPYSPCHSKVVQLYNDAYFGVDQHFTTCKTRETTIKRTIDYIFYKKSKAKLIAILKAPTDVPKYGYPNEKMPSDHIPLMATFQLYDDPNDNNNITDNNNNNVDNTSNKKRKL